MRLFKSILFIISIILIVIAIFIFILLRNFDINQYKDRAAQELSNVIGREAFVGNLELDFSYDKGVTLEVHEFGIQDDPQFNKNKILYVDTILLNVDILSFIKHREIIIKKIELHSPTIYLVKDRTGQSNIEYLITQMSNPKNDQKRVVQLNKQSIQKREVDSKAMNGLRIPKLLIESINISDGKFIYVDKQSDSQLTIPIEKINISVSHASIKESFEVDGALSFFSKKRNITFSPTVHIDIKNKQVRVDDLLIKTQLAALDQNKLKENIPQFQTIKFERDMKGEFILDVDQMIIGQTGLLVLSSNGEINNGEFQLKGMKIPADKIDIKFDVSENDIILNEYFIDFGSGKMIGKGKLNEYLSEQQFNFTLNLDNISLQDIVTAEEVGADLRGKLNGRIILNGKGFSMEHLQQNLVGQSSFEMKEGIFNDMSILKLIFEKALSPVTGKIPVLGSLLGEIAISQIEGQLSDEYKKKLNQKDTVINTFKIETEIKDGQINLKQAVMEADEFSGEFDGFIDFKSYAEINTRLYLPVILSNEIITSAKELEGLLTADNRLSLPFKPYKGSVFNFIPLPDISEIKSKVGNPQLKNVIRKALNLDDPSEGEESGEDVEGQKKEPRIEGILIENVLDILFK